MDRSCVNFHNFSIDPVKVKFGECCSYARMILEKQYEICYFILFNRVDIYARKRSAICYFNITSSACPITFKFLWWSI
jgi:hypothetical protein